MSPMVVGLDLMVAKAEQDIVQTAFKLNDKLAILTIVQMDTEDDLEVDFNDELQELQERCQHLRMLTHSKPVKRKRKLKA